jgi:hypothetical protein
VGVGGLLPSLRPTLGSAGNEAGGHRAVIAERPQTAAECRPPARNWPMLFFSSMAVPCG